MSARLTPQDRVLRSISEAAWQSQVQALAKTLGWRTFHAPRAGVRATNSVRATVAGFPDLVMVRGPRLVFAELKRQTGRTTREQDEWLTALAGTGAEVYLWLPSDLRIVEHLLRGPV